jgi:hypothetical protein
MRESRYIITILDISTRQRWVASFMLWPLYPQGKIPQYPFERSPPKWEGRGYSYPCNRSWRPIGLWDVEACTFSRQLVHTHSSEVVRFTHWQPFTPRKISRTHFCNRLSQPQGHSVAGRMSTDRSNDLIGNRTHNLLACSIVPRPTTLPE